MAPSSRPVIICPPRGSLSVPQFRFASPTPVHSCIEGPITQASEGSFDSDEDLISTCSYAPPKFGIKLPFKEIPASIKAGLDKILKEYPKATGAIRGAIIADCVRAFLTGYDIEDPAVQLAFIMVSVLGAPKMLPRTTAKQQGFIEHERVKSQDKWRACLLIKMMWFRYPELRSEELDKEFKHLLRWYEITDCFLIVIEWVRVSEERAAPWRRFPQSEDLLLVSDESITLRLEHYKSLIAEGGFCELAEQVFGDEDWAWKAIDGALE